MWKKEDGKKRKRQDRILFLGNRSDVNRLYQAMDLFVLPSRYEGLPVVGVEAQAAGLPCVLSDKVTGEVRMAENVEFLSIRQRPKEWVATILKYKERLQTDRLSGGEGKRREDTVTRVQQCGFNIEKEGEVLLNYYLNLKRY